MKNKIIKRWGKDFYLLLVKDFQEFEKACDNNEVPSGGWCNCCEKYSCGRGGVNHT